MQYQVTAGAVKAGAGALVGGWLFWSAYPSLYKWELLPFVKTEAYRRKAALMDYSGMDGIIYESYEKGTQPPRSELQPSSRGQIII